MDLINSDPVDWDIDGVVKFLCYSDPRPWAEGSNIPFPRPTDLATALQENFITGEVLLEEVDKNSLKDDLDVKPLGHRSGIMKAIEWLRSRSGKYQAKHHSSLINGAISPLTELSPKIPTSGVSKSSAPAPEVPPLNVSETAVPSSTIPHGKRRIAPQLVNVIDRNGVPNDTSRTQPPLSSTLDLEGTEVSRLFHQIAVSKPLDEEAFYNNLLQKYPPNDNDADELPVYGDSGSEGQFDEQTWEEMQNEAKELQEHSGKPTLAEKPSIPRQECIELLSQHITRMETLWREKRLPRELAKAPGLWDHSHAHGGSLDQDKEDLTKRISFYQKRLERLKAGILEVEFKDRDIFLQSCASLDPTIADICLDKWTLGVLKLENRPPRVEPPPKTPKPRKEPLDTRENESLASEIEIDLEEEDESSEFDGSASEDDESDFVEIDPEDETVQDLAELPHRGLPFTLDSPPPDDQAPPLEPSSKKRRIDNDDGSDSEVISDAGVFEAFRRGDIDTVDLTGVLPSSAGAGDPHSDALPTSSSRPQTAQDAEDSDDMQIETPPLNPAHSTAPKDADVEKLSLDNVQGSPARVKRLKLTAPRPPGSHAQHSRQTPDDDSDSTQGSSPISEDLPFGVDREDIERFDTVIPLKIEAIAASKDRLELLTKCIIGLRPHEPKQIENLLDKNLLFQLMNVVHSALIQMLNDRQRLPDMDENESLAFMRLAALYHAWLHCISLSAKGLDKPQIKDTIYRIETDETNFSFTRFVDALRKLLAAHEFWSLKHPVHSSSSHRLSTSSFKPHGKARHKLKYAPRNLSNMQKEAQARQKKQDAMRQERERRGLSNSDPVKQAVTFKEPVIYLHREIGEHVKPHQLAGIQFMWRELIEAEKPQGCLLAHVMGLGKTMQVISLLATIAEAASSVDPRIREQVPAKFHRSQTLVLCPSAVVQNWADEFALWAPKDHHLGPIWEIISGGNVEIEERFDVIMTWAEEGGVLIISYDLFRILVTNKSTRPTHRVLSDEQHELAKGALLNRPTIVVADEAHKLKNEKSAISQVASRFSTLSRIAMTGSPLANHLSEYYQMVGWVAPGYLEDAATFKTKFVDPIQSGSYLDSTVAQQRESLCALKILNGILKPKVLRADTSVIAADLPSKTEFVLRIPLTRLQEEAYNTFVSAAQAMEDADTRLYTWLAILQLCCNHPQPFLEKLADRAKQPEDTEGSVLSGTMSESGLPTDLLSRVNEIFKDTRRIEDPSLSHRASLLRRILEESIKIGDKVLIFTQSVPTLNYIHIMLTENRLKFQRIDGHTPGADRQAATKRFNAESDQQILLISTKAGGVGLNMFGANRVVIFDFLFNPTWEDQAVGRAYRLGQTKPVFVYRFLAGGTFEENIYNKAVFKRQLAVRVVDKKNVVRQSSKNSPTLLHPVQPVERQDHSEILGKDTVLDTILAGPYRDIILDVSVSHIQDNENDRLTEAESRRVDDELKMERLKRSNPQAFDAEMKRRHYAEIARQKAESVELYSQRQAAFVAAGQKHTANNQMLDYSYGLGAPSQQLGMVRYQQPLYPKPPNFQSPSEGGQPTLAGDLSSALSRVPTAHGHTIFPPPKHTYNPSSTSLVSGPPGYSQIPSHMEYAPSRSSLHQICPEDTKNPQAFNRPGAEGLPFIPTADGSADSPVEIIDLSTPREGSPEIDDAREDDKDGDAPMGMSEDEAEPTPAKSPLPGP